MNQIAIAAIILAAALLFIFGIILLGLASWIFARAIADIFRATSHGISVKTQADVAESAQEALDEIHDAHTYRENYAEPTDAELRAAAIAADEDERIRQGADITTMGNEHVEETSPVPPDQMYAPEDEDVA